MIVQQSIVGYHVNSNFRLYHLLSSKNLCKT